ncbi:MAG: DUF3459 domain-containing protein, partial [Planctomycetota bacterium]
AALVVDTIGDVRRLRVHGRDGKTYHLIANLGDAPQAVELPTGRDLVANTTVARATTLAAGAALLIETP